MHILAIHVIMISHGWHGMLGCVLVFLVVRFGFLRLMGREAADREGFLWDL